MQPAGRVSRLGIPLLVATREEMTDKESLFAFASNRKFRLPSVRNKPKYESRNPKET